MKVLSTLIVAAMALVASAAPTAEIESTPVKRDGHHGHSHGHHHGGPDIIKPDLLVQVHEANPDHAYGASTEGKVARHNGSKNVHTLVQFEFDWTYEGYQCTFEFSNPSHISGSQGIQIFTLGEYVTEQDTFNDRPFRDNHIATIDKVVQSGHSEIDSFQWGEYFDCPTNGYWAFELVPINDNDYITWSLPNGLVILASKW